MLRTANHSCVRHGRNCISTILAQQAATAARYALPLSVMVIGWGTPAGDAARGGVAQRTRAGQRIRAVLRSSDIVEELDEDHLVVVLPCTPVARATRAAQRAADALSSTPTDGEQGPFGVRIGISSLSGGHSGTQLLERAQIALQQARAAGAGRCEPLLHVLPNEWLAVKDEAALHGGASRAARRHKTVAQVPVDAAD